MKFDDLKLGDLIEFKRVSSLVPDTFVNVGIFLGAKDDLAPSSMSNYMRLYMLELGGRLFSVICWIEKDTITKIT